MNFEKILSAKVLIAINIIIIVAAELTGKFFLESGLIHFIALAFLLLGISRIFVHYNTFDRYLKPLTWGAVAALIVFALSHITEFFSFTSLTEPYSHEMYVDVTNLYMSAMLLVAVGARWFIARRDNAWGMFYVLVSGLVASIILTVLGFMRIYNVSIEPDEPIIYSYSIILVLVSILSVYQLIGIGRAVSIVKTFSIYLGVAFLLIAASALNYSLYEVLEHAGIPDYQIIYIGHFIFYIALSIMFLAFPKLVQRGGIYPSQ